MRRHSMERLRNRHFVWLNVSKTHFFSRLRNRRRHRRSLRMVVRDTHIVQSLMFYINLHVIRIDYYHLVDETRDPNRIHDKYHF